jgi:tryptophan 7-halogenase
MKICIVGGGTTGWWAAGYLEKRFPNFEITLIESEEIPIMGVGESTLPMIKTFFESMGLEEKDWMDFACAIHKYGNIKQGWDNPKGDEFAFTFWFNDDNAFGNWAEDYLNNKKNKNSINEELYDQNGWSAVAYHLDAARAGHIVKNNCKNVKHVIDTIDDLPPGYDLYIDCTGFSRKFVKDKNKVVYPHHLVNSAWVAPYELDQNIPYTKSIARPYGWQWVIGLENRLGTGYVFSDNYVSDQEAKEQFMDFNKDRIPFGNVQPRLIKWKPEILENPWSDNVVAIGLSSGFLDPLESNALFMTQFQITSLADCLERGYTQRTYNKAQRLMWLANHTYIFHHYALSQRNDTEFWKYYADIDVKKSVWDNYYRRTNKFSNLYPDSIWATLALYFDEFTHYVPKR